MQKIIWEGARPQLEMLSTLLTEALHPAADAVALTRIDAATEDGDTGVWALTAYFAETPDRDVLRAAVVAIDPAMEALAAPSFEDVPDIDWVAHSLEGLGLVEAGRFLLYGVHDEDKVADRDDAIPIRIDANQAFGTGHHPTTAGCLTLLDRLGGIEPESVFDLGCGSCVLAIAAAKLWGRPVLASDIDETSVEIARENVALNGVADLVEAIVADGFDHPQVAASAPFDFIFANILAGPLVEFAPAAAAHMSPKGRIMLAGLMAEQEAKVAAAYSAAGFRLLNRLDHETWPVLLFVKL